MHLLIESMDSDTLLNSVSHIARRVIKLAVRFFSAVRFDKPVSTIQRQISVLILSISGEKMSPFIKLSFIFIEITLERKKSAEFQNTDQFSNLMKANWTARESIGKEFSNQFKLLQILSL